MTDESKPQRAKKKRIITFIYSTGNADQKIDMVSSEVTESSVTAAWRRISSANSLPANAFLGAITGDKSLLDDRLRKPSYEELERQLALSQGQQTS